MVLEKTLEIPLDSKEIQPVHPKGNQSWIFIGRTNAEAKTPILWPPDAKKWLVGKDPDAGKDWGQEEKGTTEDEMVTWLHRLNGHEFGQTPGNSEGQGSLACCSSMGSQRVRYDWVTEQQQQRLGCRCWSRITIVLLTVVGCEVLESVQDIGSKRGSEIWTSTLGAVMGKKKMLWNPGPATYRASLWGLWALIYRIVVWLQTLTVHSDWYKLDSTAEEFPA